MLEVIVVPLERCLQVCLDVIPHKIGTVVAIGTVAVKDAEQDAACITIEFLNDLKGILVSLVQILGVIAALRKEPISQLDPCLRKGKMQSLIATLNASIDFILRQRLILF